MHLPKFILYDMYLELFLNIWTSYQNTLKTIFFCLFFTISCFFSFSHQVFLLQVFLLQVFFNKTAYLCLLVIVIKITPTFQQSLIYLNPIFIMHVIIHWEIVVFYLSIFIFLFNLCIQILQSGSCFFVIYLLFFQLRKCNYLFMGLTLN